MMKPSSSKRIAFNIKTIPCTYHWNSVLCQSIFHARYRYKYMKNFIAKRVISILVNLRHLRFKLLKYKENNKKICNTFDHNLIFLYI